jgi:ComF family protein
VFGRDPSSRLRPADLVAAGLHLVFPVACAVCREPLGPGRVSALCRGCWERLERLAPVGCVRCGWPFPDAAAAEGVPAPLCQRCRESRDQFDAARAALCYREAGVARAAILLCKHGGQLGLLRRLGLLLADEAPRRLDLARVEAVIPVPLHWQRRWRRGFNQAEILGRAVARRHGIPLLRRALVRRRPTPPQQGDATARRANVRDAFSVRTPRRVCGRRLLLVDDVFTTGATANACAAALRRAGAAGVDVLTLARVA